MKRRTFLQRISETSLLAAAPTALELSAKAAPSNRLQAGMIGSAGRAAALNRLFAVNPEVDIAAIELEQNSRDEIPPILQGLKIKKTEPRESANSLQVRCDSLKSGLT